jgi:hypothetical protein
LKSPFIVLAPTLAAARREARRFPGAGAATPRSARALAGALDSGRTILVADPARRDPRWEAEKRRIFLPGAPELLRNAIGGIVPGESPEGPATPGGPDRAHWVPGDLTDRRARALLAAPPVPSLWIVEDFRRVRISPPVSRRLSRAGVRLAAFRALRRTSISRARARITVDGKMAR